MRRYLFTYLILCAPVLAQRGNIGYDQIRQADRKGTGQQIQMFCNGTATPAGTPAIYDANGNICPGSGSGGGSLTVQPPTKFPRYQAPVMPMGLSVTNPITLANSTSATSMIGSQYFGSAVLPGGWWIGKTIKIRASGYYGTTGSPALTITVLLGGVTVATISPAVLTGASNDGWLLDYALTVASLTAVNGAGCFTDLGTSSAIIGGCASGQTTGLNFGTAQTLDLQFQWSVASASNTITAEVLEVL